MFTTTTTFIVYIFAMIVIGIVAARSTSSLNDYVLGGRKLGRVITGLSAGASDMSGWLLMGLPGALFVSGISKLGLLLVLPLVSGVIGNLWQLVYVLLLRTHLML